MSTFYFQSSHLVRIVRVEVTRLSTSQISATVTSGEQVVTGADRYTQAVVGIVDRWPRTGRRIVDWGAVRAPPARQEEELNRIIDFLTKDSSRNK